MNKCRDSENSPCEPSGCGTGHSGETTSCNDSSMDQFSCPDSSQVCDESTCGPEKCAQNKTDAFAFDDEQRPGYSVYPFVEGWLNTSVGKIPQVSTKLSTQDKREHWALRWGIGRNNCSITPGLYAVGNPGAESHIFVSANYKFSFDCLRSALKTVDAWLLVIDTKGINVWCAAGKGTFGTEEIISRINKVRLHTITSQKKLIVPQLGAPGIAAYKIKQETGFSIIYGPVRAKDLDIFLANNLVATEEMRQVSFSTWERLVLTPVEVVLLSRKILYATIILFVLSGIGSNIFSFSSAWHRGIAATIAGLVGVLSGAVLTPILLPWLPTKAFASKGALLGLITASVLALGPYQNANTSGLLALYLFILAISSYTAMTFTGSSTYTSPSGVEKEMRIALPCQILAVVIAGLLWIGGAF